MFKPGNTLPAVLLAAGLFGIGANLKSFGETRAYGNPDSPQAFPKWS
jgi:hypothetical protein